MKARLLPIIACLCFTPTSFAYPISPRTLWQLVKEADAVVVADVVALAGAPVLPLTFKDVTRGRRMRSGLPAEAPSGTFFGGGDAGFAQLRVVETLKGDAITEAWVQTHEGMICPAPPRFVKDQRVLAFLKGDADGTWRVAALSYGTLYPDEAELGVFRERIAEAITLQQATAADESARVDWLVRLASRRATRWHGLYELRPAMDAAHHYYDRRGRAGTLGLTPEQRALLAEGFAREPSSGPNLAMMLAAVGDHASPQLDAVAAGVIEQALLTEPDADWLPEAIVALAARLNLSDLLKDLPELTTRRYDASPVVVRGAWDRIKKARPDLRVSPISIDDTPKVRGVGAETPP